MEKAIGIELMHSEYHDIIKPFLPLAHSFKDRSESIYIFSSMDEVNDLKEELSEFHIIEAIHQLYFLKNLYVYHAFWDYGFKTKMGHYVFANLTSRFSIHQGNLKDREMALLQFDEHLLARKDDQYFIDQHHQELIENIAKAYNITILFFELDKLK